MRPGDLPSELSIRQLATVLGLTVPAIRYRIKQGVIPSKRIGTGRGAHIAVPINRVQREFPELWDAIVFRMQACAFDEEDLDDE